ncbi:MAG: sugar ABC transporter permease [Tyzzerella sp.]|nr:sugar ABC transporter permease [Tyzzerella sp.]
MQKKERRLISFEKKQRIAGYVFISPLIFGFLVLFLPSIIKTFVFSFNEIVIGNSTYTLEWKGWEYYHEALFVDADFIQHVIKSLGEMLVYVPTIIIFSLFMASMLNQKFHGRVFARAIFFLPVVLATGIVTKADMAYDLVGSMTGRTVLEDSEQLVNMASFLYSLNFNEDLTKIVVSAANGIEDIVNSSGMQIFILLAAFQEIPPSSYEAAAIDGASKWETFWKITIPSVKNQIVVVAIYTIIDIFTKTDNQLFSYIHDIGFQGNQYGLAMAMYIIYLLAIGVMLGIAMLFIGRAIRKSEG